MEKKMKCGALWVLGGLTIGLLVMSENKGYGIDRSVGMTPSQDAVIATLIAGLKARESSVKTGTGYVTNENYINSDRRIRNSFSSSPVMLKTYDQMPGLNLEFWAADGRKTRGDSINLVPRNSSYFDMVAFDGQRYEEWYPASYRTANLYAGGDDRPVAYGPTVLQLGIGKRPWKLSKVLEGRPLSLLGKEVINGVETYKLQAGATDLYRETEICWIAPDEDYLLVKKEWQPVGINDPHIASARSFFVVDKAEEVDGIWVPQSTRTVGFVTYRGHGEIWENAQRLVVQSVRLNEPVSPGMFDLPLPLQTWVRPGDSGLKEYRVGGDYTADERRVSSNNVTPADLRETPQ